jgi:nitroreductase
MPSEFDLEMTDRLLTTTRSVRKRLDFTRPVEPGVINECLDVALQAATGGNTQRWRWVVVSDADKRRALGEIYRRAFREILDVGEPESTAGGQLDAAAEMENDYHVRFADTLTAQERLMSSVDHLIEHLSEAPIHIVPCVVGRIEGDVTKAWISSQYGSVYPAVWNLSLALRSRGLGTCITGAHLEYEEEAAELLGIPFDRVMQICLLPVAYYTGDSFRPARRRPMDEVVFWDEFDVNLLDETGW